MQFNYTKSALIGGIGFVLVNGLIGGGGLAFTLAIFILLVLVPIALFRDWRFWKSEELLQRRLHISRQRL